MPYINTIDINGTTYHLKNLTDGDYVVDLPDLNKSDIFLVRGDVVNNLNSDMVRNVLIPLPTMDEQKEIADIFDKITKLINLVIHHIIFRNVLKMSN